MKIAVADNDPAGLERTSPTESADIDEIVRGMLAIQAQAAAAGKRPLSRGTHAKGTCVRGVFEVFDLSRTPGPSDRLSKGIFAKPGSYPAIIRFANADGGHRPDRWRDVRALSFAVEVPPDALGGVARLDFSLNSASTFPINDAHAFAVAVRVLSAQGLRAKWTAFRSLSWADFRGLLRTIRLGGKQKRGTPLLPYQQLRYWSTVPFRHGERDAVKYSAIPHDNPARPLQSAPNRLQDELVRHVNEDDRMSAFTFALQLLEPGTMTHDGVRREASFWVENAAVEWKESESPFYPVARLTLLPKSVLTPSEAESFSIDVTEHSTPETRPIGSINRARWHGERASREARAKQPVAATSWTPVRRGPGIVKGAFAAAALLFIAALAWAMRPVTRDLPERLTYPEAPLGANGLTNEERQQYYHLSEGGEAYPIAWLLALEQKVTDPTGRTSYRPFLENIERFGLLPDPPSRFNPYGLPVGVTAGYGKITGQQMMGLNCSACHVGELHYQGRAFRVDGGPSMAYINAFIESIVTESRETARDGERRGRFLNRWRRVQLVPLPETPAVQRAGGSLTAEPSGVEETLDAGDPGVIRRVLAGLRSALSNRSLLLDKLHGFAAVKFVVQAKPLGTEDGYGRNDAFGIGRTELFGAYTSTDFAEGLNVLPADAPVSFPHLWGMERTSWFQWGVNTNSVIERNIGQALGVGATFQPDRGFSSTVRVDNLHAMENFQYKLSSPRWPVELLGRIDPARAERGKKIFDRTCALCHETYEKQGRLNEYQLFALDVVGTDPSVAINFERSVMTPDGPKPFGAAAFEIVGRVKEAYYRDNNISKETQDLWEGKGMRPTATFRTPLRDYDKYPDTKHRGVYRAKTLKGIWATAPYLHNGSVPTIFDLLHPAEKRPRVFKLGTKEYDPAKLGYVTDGPRFLTPPGMAVFEFDTHRTGNWNTGHEWWFYTDLDDGMRYDIIEFLKTFDDANYPGDYTFERPAMLPDNVRMKESFPVTKK